MSHGVPTARRAIDAKTGDLGDVAGVSGGGDDDRHLPPWQDADDFLKRIDRSSLDAGGGPRVVRAARGDGERCSRGAPGTTR